MVIGLSGVALAALWGVWSPAPTTQTARAQEQTAPAQEAGPAASPVADSSSEVPTSLAEARLRAKILHETVHGALQVMHRDFFDDENPLAIPSASLEDVFEELQRGYGIRLRWLVVNADALNVDHNPQSEFDRAAVRALAGGASEYELADTEEYQYAGRIRLASQCLKCHVKRRITNEDRAAGVVISIPLRRAE